MSDFVMQIGADLDLSKVQEQLDSIKKQKVTLDIDIKGNDDAHNLAKSIEKGLKATKIDTSGLSKQLADAFNITDKSVVNKIKSQINSVMSELGKTWNGKEFNLQGGKGKAFISGLSDLANSVSQNANIIQGKMGIYDQFYSYFKDKKIYVSDDLKKALSGDDYKELLNNNIGHIVRDASKGVSIDSIWGEMTSMFPEHFADNITNQADQIKRAFEVLTQARQDMVQTISAQDMTPEQFSGIKADAFDEVISMANQMRERLQQNIETASEGVKNTYDLDVDINTEKIVSDIRNAILSATSGAEDAVQINVKINDEELLSQMRSAISQLATGDEPVQVDIQVNKQSLEADLEVALKDVELPIKFKIDSEQMAADIQAAVNQITDVEINLRVNTDSLRSSVEGAVNNGGSNVPTVDTSGMSELQNILNGLNNAGVQGQSVFQSFGNTLKDAFSTFTAANLLTDAIYKVGDAARDAVSTVKELDDATIALQLATGANYNTVHGMMNDYNALAKELGSLTTQVSEGADAWLRQGKSIEEVNNLVKSSMVLSKVGDMSSEDATKYLTASLNGYKLQADAAESVVDKISSVDLVSATDSAGLAEAMSRVAVTADQAGISMDRLLSYVATIGEVTQQSTNATNADTKATQSHTKATNDSTKATKKSKKTLDWVAERLKTWEKKVKKFSDQVTDFISSAFKTSLLKKQMKTMSKEISSNSKGELAYMKKANSVAKNYTYYDSDGDEINVSIPKKYQRLVQSGAYRVEDMDTSTDEGKALAEAIEQYQSWYEKAQDCKQAVVDLRNEQQKLFEQWANMPTEAAEKKIDRLTTGYNGINAVSSRLTAATKGGSTQAALAETMKSDLTDAENQKKADNKTLKAAKTANKKASTAKKKANNKVKSTAKSLLKTNLTDEQKKQVQAGKKIDSTGMSGSQKKKADAYNKAVTNKTKANKKATSAKSKLSTAKSNYNSSNSTYKSMKSNVNTALNAYDSGNSLSYMNGLVDEQVSGKKSEQEARKKAVEQANANVTTAKNQKTAADKKLANLQKKYKNSKTLTAAQKKKMAAGKAIDTTGITDTKQLKILNAYNNALADSKKKAENVTIATDALATANENLMTAEVESAQATVEAISTKFDNAKTYYEALLSYQEQLSNAHEKNIDLTKAHGDYEKSSDYDTKISDKQAERAIKQNEVNELTKQLNDGVAAGTIVENSQEWLDMTTQIKEAENAVADYDNTIEELKQQQIGVYYEEQFERAAEKVDRFRDKLDGLKALISDDMKIDKNTGLLTESGALAITLDVDDINASTENLKTYIKERQQIINDYNAGKFGEDEYNQKLKDIDENIKSTTANIYSSRNSILELVKSQSQAELDVLNKVIDKRKEALSAKKSYYDYDKTLKNKTKDIEVLERQIAALEGSTSAEDKARKAKLQEQLQSAKDDLNDTITDHAYSMQTDALDKLSTDMSEDLDKWINTISSNMEEMTTAINDAVKNAGLSTAGTINAISSILRHYGLSDSEISQSGLSDIKGYASGTDYVPKSGMYRVNEKGMESVFSKQYGTLTFLSQGDKVFTADFTKQLLDNSTIATQKNMPDYAGMAKAIEKNIQNIQNLSGNTYVNNFYIDGAQDTDSILKEIDKHLDKKIQAHDKKQVRDFRSLH